MTRPLRLVVFDATDTAPVLVPRVERRVDGTAHGTGGLTRWWRVGARLHRVVRRADAAIGARSWGEALRWARAQARVRGAPIGEVQAWGHGGWGFMGMGGEALDRAALAEHGARADLADDVDGLRDVLAPDAIVWLRCCSAFGAEAGRAFGSALAERLRTRVAGHTFIIGVLQSGTHSVASGEDPRWPVDEGVETVGGEPRGALESSAFAPHTITCFRPGLPPGW